MGINPVGSGRYALRRAMRLAAAMAVAVTLCPTGGHAQLLGTPLPNAGVALPPPLPQIPQLPGAGVPAVDTPLGSLNTPNGSLNPLGQALDPLDRIVNPLNQTLDAATETARDAVGRPQQTNVFGQDQTGARVARDEVLAMAPSEAGLELARALGFEITRDETMSSLGLRMVTLHSPNGMTALEALEALRRADPSGSYDLNHVYDPSGDSVSDAAGLLTIPPGPSAKGISIGLVDAGIDQRHPALSRAKIVAANMMGGHNAPATAHGTAIAALLVGDSDRYRGSLPGATLYAADVYGGEALGGTADSIVRGLAWLADKDVAVITISLAGPPNRLLEAAVGALTAKGHVIVAAVGNDGPATPVSYPAAYEGVIAVTSVDSTHAVQLDANRGPQIAFAALGVNIKVANLQQGYVAATGTSFAAPLVAARFARELQEPDAADAARVIWAMEQDAVDLGVPGRDPVFGFGYLDSTPALDRRLASP